MVVRPTTMCSHLGRGESSPPPLSQPPSNPVFALGWPYTYHIREISQFPVDVPRVTLMHDMAITEHYAVFLDLPLLFKPERMLKGNFPLFYDETQEARFDS